jgi:S-adenosylmethionine:tRNA ribosyltransferase-isomerase
MLFNAAPINWLLSDFDFHLPDERIAAKPISPRDHAKLLHVNGKQFSDHHVFDLPDLLQDGDLLVLNDTKVVPARLFGLRGEVKIEILLNKPQSHAPSIWSSLAKPAKRLKLGQTIIFASDFSAEVIEKCENGDVLLRFHEEQNALFEKLKKYGHVPLPPYIKRSDTFEDKANYQTIYAAREGAVAAPTAGLHFTPELFDQLDKKGIARCAVTLHVGAGTFLPVKTERVADHKMHSEWGEITPETAATINAAKKQGRRIVAVGTTSLRLLESATDNDGNARPFMGETDIFITPSYRFKCVDAMITNFHLPKSTLFMLVAALAGFDNMRQAYAHAIAKEYRFYSYGDACLLEKEA